MVSMSPRTSTIVFAVLMLLLVATVGAAFVPYDRWQLGWAGVAIALTIAATKAILIARFFMHLSAPAPLPRLLALMAIVWLGILFALSWSDYLTRSWLPASRGWTESAARRESEP